jgi:hypothetical protein
VLTLRLVFHLAVCQSTWRRRCSRPATGMPCSSGCELAPFSREGDWTTGDVFFGWSYLGSWIGGCMQRRVPTRPAIGRLPASSVSMFLGNPDAGPLRLRLSSRRRPRLQAMGVREQWAARGGCHVGQVKDVSGLETAPCEPPKPLKMRDPLWAGSAPLTSKIAQRDKPGQETSNFHEGTTSDGGTVPPRALSDPVLLY